MIKDKTVKVKMIGPNIDYYKSMGLNFFNKSIVEIPFHLVNRNSHYKVISICDICGKERTVTIKNYYKQIEGADRGMDLCQKCSHYKRKKTNKIKYNNENYTNRDQAKKTCTKKYGVDHISKVSIYKSKVKNTMKAKYGEHFSKTEEFLQKFRKTMNEKYGVDYPMQSNIIRQKSIDTCIKKYGVENVSQNGGIHEKKKKTSSIIHKFLDTDLFYQGSFELDFLEKFWDLVEIKNAPIINYILEGRKKVYYPDFYIPAFNLIVEIKGNYFYKKFEKIVEQKAIFTKKAGYNYLLIMDKNYSEFIKIIQLS